MSLEFDDMPGMGMGVMSKDLSVGALLVCEIASAILFGVLTVQCGIYFDRYKQDKKGLRTLVYTIWFLEFLHQMFSAWWTYQIGIQEFGNMMFMMKSGWRVGAESAAMTLTALIVQLFYARRGYLLNRSLWPISLLVTILAFVAFGAGMAASIEMITLPYFGDFMYYMWLQEIWFSSEAATDLFVALIVVYSLGAVKKSGYSSTESGLWRLIMYTISNGVLTSILAFAVIALFKLLPNTLTHPGVAFLLSRVYSNSLLASLNLRGTWIKDKKTNQTSAEFSPERFVGTRKTQPSSKQLVFAVPSRPAVSFITLSDPEGFPVSSFDDGPVSIPSSRLESNSLQSINEEDDGLFRSPI